MIEVLNQFDAFLWGWFLIIILLGTGIFLTIRYRGVQFRHFGEIFANIKKSMKKGEGGKVSGFGALCSALGSQVGTGNLVGVASALFSGGPGAVFWMWITALIGMATNFTEVVLGQLYRERDKDGNLVGSPCYYMMNGLKNKKLGKGLAVAYAICVVLGIGVVYAMLQSNSVVMAVHGMNDKIPLWAVGIVLAVLAGLVVFGGAKRLADVSSLIVPFMAIAYLLIAVIVIAINITKMPAVFALIFKSAFSVRAVAGGVLGHTMREAIRYGVARGLFSNDAGNGTAAALHSAAEVKHPFKQGLSGMLGVFVDTIIVCSCTALIILSTGALESGKEGIELTQYALSTVLGRPGAAIILVAMFLFGFTSLLADIQIGEVNLGWACHRNKKVLTAYRVFGVFLAFLGAIVPTSLLWVFVDILTAFMVLINVGPLIAMSGKVREVVDDYEKAQKEHIEDPVWHFEEIQAESGESAAVKATK